MQKDFHYYATYCAAYLAGYSHEESMTIAYSTQFVDCCTETLLRKIQGPLEASTTQSQVELLNTHSDPISLQKVTRIWASFHFLPYDLRAQFNKKRSKRFMYKYRLICKPNGSLLANTVKLAKNNSLQAAGLAMHVLADTWAHSYFAGTPSNVINNTNYYFYELLEEDGEKVERKVNFIHNPTSPDDLKTGEYSSSLHQENENSIMSLGHGRAGHLPDYSFIRYKYMPSWGEYHEIIKDNPKEYLLAFRQMVYALKYLRGEIDDFLIRHYDLESVDPWKEDIQQILTKRQLHACDDWKKFGEMLSGKEIEEFDVNKYEKEYIQADPNEKDETFLGLFFLAAMAQKSMVTNKIYKSGNLIAGFSIEYQIGKFKGLKDYKKLIDIRLRGGKNE